ncbi:MAG: ATP-binding protein [Streptosporangiaceae bacterium]|nr:ATP-binding protein [Streptosporangiaceae bacterium]
MTEGWSVPGYPGSHSNHMSAAREAAVIIGGWRGPGWRVVDADPGHGKQIRDWIRSAVSRHDCPVDPLDAALVVSELFANALMHGPPGGRVLVGYCLWREGARVVVCDGGGPGAPRLVYAGAGLADGGRGMHVVDSLAARWGSFRLSGARVVWCDFGQPLRAPASDAWAWLRLVLSYCSLTPLWETAELPAGRCLHLAGRK